MSRPPLRDPSDETVYACDSCGGNICPAEGVLGRLCPPCEDELAVWTDGTDTVIATNVHDCADIMAEFEGDPANYEDYLENGWEKYNKPELTIQVEGMNETKPVTKRTSEWIKEEGRGFLASTEF